MRWVVMAAALFAAERNLRSPLRAEATLDANDDAALLTLAGSASLRPASQR